MSLSAALVPTDAGPRPEATPGPVLDLPRLCPGVQQLGVYQGSALTSATYLVRNARGQVVQVSRLLNQVLTGVDGRSTLSEIAARVTLASGRPVSAGNVEYLLSHKIAPLGLLAGSHDVVAPAPVVLGLKLRRTLVPAAGVQHIARLLQPLFTPAVMVAAVIALAGSDTWIIRAGRLGPTAQMVLLRPPLVVVVVGLTVLSMLFHECGHAAACRYGGARPGVIGMGFYVVWPAFFTNVTDTYRLSRVDRIRTDLGGVYFNVIFVLALMTVYLCTGYAPLIPAVFLIHMEIIQQLLPSLRLDGYFILADLIGVPDLFRRIGPILLSVIPGRPPDPRVQGLKRGPRVVLTAWILLVVPLLGFELALIVVNAPSLAGTFARSLKTQAGLLTTQLSQNDLPAVLASVFSVLMLVLPIAGLCYILLLTGRRAASSLITVNRQHRALRLPSVIVVLALVAALGMHWGLLPSIGGRAGPGAAAAVHVPAPRPWPRVTPARPVAAPPVAAPPVTLLSPVSALGFDPLGTAAGGTSDENSGMAGYAVDDDPATAWKSQFYLGNPVFGGLKTGSGLILDMGRTVRLSSVAITFGSVPGADVAIEVGNHAALAVSTLATFRTVASADDVGGTHVFRATRSAEGRYLLIWFTKLPPAGAGQFQAQIFNIGIRGTASTGQRRK